jgi:hypothetical protein
MVAAVARDGQHRFTRSVTEEIVLVAGVAVRGDAHAGATAQHRSRVARAPTQPYLRQVHLIHAELFEELRATGFEVAVEQLGENLTTSGINLHALPRGTRLHLSADTAALLELVRVSSGQVRVFPLLEHTGRRNSQVLDQVLTAVREHGITAEVREVGYEFQHGGNRILVLQRGPDRRRGRGHRHLAGDLPQ